MTTRRRDHEESVQKRKHVSILNKGRLAFASAVRDLWSCLQHEKQKLFIIITAVLKWNDINFFNFVSGSRRDETSEKGNHI